MFSPGDLVVCVNADKASSLQVGQTYRVRQATGKGFFVNLEGFLGGYFSSRFELASPKPLLSLEEML